VAAEETRAPARTVRDPALCSFCGKLREQVLALLAARCVAICDECVEQAVLVLAEANECQPHQVLAALRARRQQVALAGAVKAPLAGEGQPG
jgi:ATP-dependent protease Clp ATPase subunit